MALDSFIGPQFIAIVIFITTYFFMATGWRSRAIAAIAGAAAMWGFGILSSNEMIGYVDLNALGLLFGMMVLVGARSSLLQHSAYSCKLMLIIFF
jgi:Na+/H+ antiporter NhaD/arsenite permease-like protein